ncbi:MAG: S1/P1 nuclease [Congregibacter sp.]
MPCYTHHLRCVSAKRLRQLFATVCVLGLGAFSCFNANAWGPLGHELAGDISERYLSLATQKRIRALIGNESIAEASTWADRMRSDPSQFWQREAGAYHYVTVPQGRQYRDITPPRKGDALTALSEFREALLDESTPIKQRALALRFAIHIVQDLHQPLHVGRRGDRGGNDVDIRVNGKRSNLHRLWDSQVLYSAGRSDRQWRSYFDASELLRAPITADADPFLWVQESAALRETLYPAPKQADKAYMQRQLPRAEIRVALAGIRTAAWLNATLGNPAPPPAMDTRQSWWENLFKE